MALSEYARGKDVGGIWPGLKLKVPLHYLPGMTGKIQLIGKTTTKMLQRYLFFIFKRFLLDYQVMLGGTPNSFSPLVSAEVVTSSPRFETGLNLRFN